MNERVQASLAGVNKKLLEVNIGVVKEILLTGKSSSVGGTGSGVDFDIKYVLHEQRTLTKYLKENPLSDYDNGVINRLLNTGDLFLGKEEFKLAKILTNSENLDYGVEKQRFAIGHSLTFLKHLESGSFKGTGKNNYRQYLDFFKVFYGKTASDKFQNYIETNHKNAIK